MNVLNLFFASVMCGLVVLQSSCSLISPSTQVQSKPAKIQTIPTLDVQQSKHFESTAVSDSDSDAESSPSPLPVTPVLVSKLNVNDKTQPKHVRLKVENKKAVSTISAKNTIQTIQRYGIVWQAAKDSKSRIFVSMAQGTVIYVGTSPEEKGKMIIVQHAHDFMSAYSGNMSSIDVSENEKVTRGQKLGRLSSTQTSLSHWHVDVRKEGKVVDIF